MCDHLSRWRLLLDLTLFDEVLPRTEGFVAGAGDDGDSEARLGVEPIENGICFPLGSVRKRVHGMRTVDGDKKDVGGGIGEDVVRCRWGFCLKHIRHGRMLDWICFCGRGRGGEGKEIAFREQ